MTAPGETSATAPSADNPPSFPVPTLDKLIDERIPRCLCLTLCHLTSREISKPNHPAFTLSFYQLYFSCGFWKYTDAFPCLGFNVFDSPSAAQQVTMGCPSRETLPATRTAHPTTHLLPEISTTLRREQITAPWQQFPRVPKKPKPAGFPKKTIHMSCGCPFSSFCLSAFGPSSFQDGLIHSTGARVGLF